MKTHIALLVLLAGSLWASPPVPTRHVTDKAGVLKSQQLESLDRILVDYESKTSNQLIVYVDKTLGGASIDDTIQWCHDWGIGQKGKDNGAALFLFIGDRKSAIRTGYGMEASLPDATCKTILDGMRTKLRSQDYSGALTDATAKMIAAMDGTLAAPPSSGGEPLSWFAIIVIIAGVLVVLFVIGAVLSSEGGSGSRYSGSTFHSGSSGSSSGGSHNPSSSFRSGGGGFGGGGASSGW